jgi:hypothetical protein
MRLAQLLTMAAMLAFCLLAGCSNPAARLVGKWEAQLAPPATEGMSVGERISGAVVSLMKMNLEFTADGRMGFHASVPGGSTDIQGTWKYLKPEGDVAVLEITPDGASGSFVTRVTLVDANTIEMIPPSGGPATEPLRFRRVGSSPASAK